MNTIRFQTKSAFIDALESRRSFWHEVDLRATRKHKEREAAWLKEARTKLRAMAKLDYEALKDALKWDGDIQLGKVEECPKLWEPRLDKVLAALRLTQGTTFSVDSEGTWREAHTLLTYDPDARVAAC